METPVLIKQLEVGHMVERIYLGHSMGCTKVARVTKTQAVLENNTRLYRQVRPGGGVSEVGYTQGNSYSLASSQEMV